MISHDPKIPFLIQSLDIALYRTFGESAMYSRDQQSVQLACAILEACRDSCIRGIRAPTGFPGLCLGPLQDKAENA